VVDTFKATVDFTLVFDPNNPAVVVIKSDLKIIGTAFGGGEIALNFKNLTSVPKASFSDAVKTIYTDVVNAVVDSVDTFVLKPAAIAISSAIAYQARPWGRTAS